MNAKPESPSDDRADPASEVGSKPFSVTEFYKPENYAPMNSVGYLMRRIVTAVSQEAERQLEGVGLTHAQWMPLYKLSLGHGSTVAELARGCQLDAGGMTRLLDRMEAKGLCRRVRSSEDRRVVNIELTPEGREAAKHIPVALSNVQNRYLAGFSEADWRTLTGLLQRILENVEASTASDKQP
jgi:DNA-binding MarR family transcriptional regulator